MDYLYPVGDCAIRVSFGDSISPKINKKIRQFCHLLDQKGLEGVNEWVPTYRAVTVFYDPLLFKFSEIKKKLNRLYEEVNESYHFQQVDVYYIPTCYDKTFGVDLPYIGKYHQMEINTIIRLHSEPYYLIYMLGFSPGFPYLGGMRREIATPRLTEPRIDVEAGSVGIAGNQTGIYPISTPGGWRIIGKTPIKLFDLSQDRPTLLQAGDYLKFVPINIEEYNDIKEEVKHNKYKVKIKRYRGDEIDLEY